MPAAPPRRLPDLLVGLFCAAVIVILLLVIIKPNVQVASRDARTTAQLRSIYQALLLYGFDNADHLPGLNPDGTLFTNDPAARFDLLTRSNHLAPATLVDPDEPDASVKYSYAILDLAIDGDRRRAWTTTPNPDAPLLAQRPPGTIPAPGTTPAPGTSPESSANNSNRGWTGWVQFHRPALDAGASLAEHHDTPRLRTRYAPDGPHHENDDLFAAAGPDDAYLIATE